MFGTAIVASVSPKADTAIVRPLFGLATRALIWKVPASRTYTS